MKRKKQSETRRRRGVLGPTSLSIKFVCVLPKKRVSQRKKEGTREKEDLLDPERGEEPRKTKVGPKTEVRLGPNSRERSAGIKRGQKEGGAVKKERREERVEGRERGPVWLTDDLIKRGTNYRPAGC